MGRISDDDIRRVRDATDLISLVQERVLLKQKGRLFWGCCPFHQEKTASFKVDPATQLWHCFGCGLGGDAYGYLMRTDSVEFIEAVRILADRAHIEISEEAGGLPKSVKERLIAASEAAAAFYFEVLTKSKDAGATRAREYLKGRGFGSEVAGRWRLGYAPGRSGLVKHLAEVGFTADEIIGANLALRTDSGELRDRFYERVMFPITDLQGRTIAFGGRVIGSGEPKYLNTQDTPIFHKSANMYGIDRAKALITSSGTGIVVEGYTDVIALHEAGVANAVATLGTALTREHVRLLSRFAKRVVYLFDGDAAGLRAADRAVEFIDASITPEAGRGRVELAVAVIPGGLDPADLVAKSGAVALTEVVATAAPLLQFAIDRRLDRWDLERPEQRARALKDAAEVLAPIKQSLLADDYVAYIADRLFADIATVKREIVAARVAPAVAVAPSEIAAEGEPAAPASQQVRLERDVLDLMVRHSRLRVRACFLLSENLLTDPMSQAIAAGIANNETLSTTELVGVLEALCPGAATALSGVQLGEVSDADADGVCADLMRRLKEFELERRIALGRSRLRQPGAFENPAQYDALFKEVSGLQGELAEYHSGARNVGDDDAKAGVSG